MEDCAKYCTYTADPVRMGRKSCLYTLLAYSALAWLSAHTDGISCIAVFGTISSSSILWSYLYITYSSIVWSIYPCKHHQTYGTLPPLPLYPSNFLVLPSFLLSSHLCSRFLWTHLFLYWFSYLSFLPIFHISSYPLWHFSSVILFISSFNSPLKINMGV